MNTEKTTDKTLNLFHLLGWAFYLACSWTWCIGMFLPVILIRDYGPCGWLLFAVPNILGATMMAYTLTKPSISNEITEKHRVACTVFSFITIIFQIYFTGWISLTISNTILANAVFILFLVYILGLIVKKNELFSAFMVFLLSIACFILIFYFSPMEKIDLFKSGNLIHNTSALLCLAPVCFFGFLLCPYLDLTFHKARQSNTSSNSKIIFTTGFCFLFLIMMVFTFFYSRPLASIIEGNTYLLKDQTTLPLKYIFIVVFHMIIQAGFTIILHLKSIYLPTKRQTGLGLILSIALFFLPTIFNGKYTFLDLSINEVLYRSFIAFYSLVAPAYVLFFMIPKNNKNIPLNKHNLLIWITAVLFALPFYATAFLGVKWNLEACSLLGLAIVLFYRKLIRQN